MDKLIRLCIMLSLFCILNVHAEHQPQGAAYSNDNCWSEAGKRYQIDPWLLYSIAEVESGLRSNAIGNNNNSIDIGIMQINTFWFEKIKKYGYKKIHLLNPCVNIFIGAWILAQSFEIFGKNWQGLGAYNAGTRKSKEFDKKRMVYANKVMLRYNYHVERLQLNRVTIKN